MRFFSGRKRWRSIFLLVFFSFAGVALAQANDHIIIKLKPNVVLDQSRVANHSAIKSAKPLFRKRNGTVRPGDSKDARLSRTYMIELKAGASMKNMISELSSSAEIEYAEPDYKLELQEINDPFFNDQWALARISAEAAWTYTTGNDGIIIAVLDSGIAPGHPDLAAQLTAGYDFINDDEEPEDNMGHGTQVAGIIAAEGNNAEGIIGVCPGCTIMPIKVKDLVGENEVGYVSDLVDGIQYAMNNGARILNLSLSVEAYSQTLKDALADAYDMGLIIVAASGNNSDSMVSFPAAFPETIAVGATSSDDNRSYFSNYGQSLELVAPGDDIISTTLNGEYVSGSGTSFAAPHVAGLAGLLLDVYPNSSNEEIRYILHNAIADQVGDPQEDEPGWDIYHGWGRINTEAAMTIIVPTEALDEPVSLEATRGILENTVALAWDPSQPSGWYHIYRSITLGGDKEWIGATGGAAFNDANVDAGQPYYYWVTTQNGAYPGDYGEAVVGCSSPDGAPTSPNNVFASAGTYTDKVVITWTPVCAAVNGYRVYRSITAEGTKSFIGAAEGDAFEDDGTVSGVLYYYWVTAVDINEMESDYGDYSMGYCLAPPVSAPSWVSASDGSYPLGIIVRWESVPEATHYYVYRATSPDGSKSVRQYTSASSYIDTGMPVGKKYYYWVRARDASGNLSPFSPYNSGYRGSYW